MVSDKKNFYVSPYISLCKACDPWGVALYLAPVDLFKQTWFFVLLLYSYGHGGTVKKKVHQMMLYTKYQGSRPCGYKQEDFFMFLPIKAYVKPVTPEARPFLAQGL